MSKLTSQRLKKLGIPAVLVAGLLTAHILGWDAKALNGIKNYHQISQLFPSGGYVQKVEDGDTFVLINGIIVRLIGINAPDRGQKNFDLAKSFLTNSVKDKKVYLEYDRYQDDKFGRIVAWVWVDCEKTPKFLPADYMHLSNNASRPGLTENPEGCKKGKLINEELIKNDYAKIEVYKDRGPTKYEARLKSIK